MNKKEFSIIIIVAGLTILFAIAACALFLSKGKSKFWTAKKMKLGAMILTLTVTGTSCHRYVTCYAPQIEKANQEIHLINLNNSDTIYLKNTSVIKGNIQFRESTEFSFKLQNDSDESIYQTVDIIPDDGIFDESNEEFTINLDTGFKTGNYSLMFYETKKEAIGGIKYPLKIYNLKIINEQ